MPLFHKIMRGSSCVCVCVVCVCACVCVCVLSVLAYDCEHGEHDSDNEDVETGGV